MPEETDLERITITAEAESATPRPELTEQRTIRVVGLALEATPEETRVRPGADTTIRIDVTVREEEGEGVGGETVTVRYAPDSVRGRLHPPEEALTDESGGAFFDYRPGVEEGMVGLELLLQSQPETTATVEIDQSGPHFDVVDSGDPYGRIVRVYVTGAGASKDADVRLEDVEGVVALEADGRTPAEHVDDRTCLLAAVIGDLGKTAGKQALYQRQAAALRERAAGARKLAGQIRANLTEASWWEAFSGNTADFKRSYYDPLTAVIQAKATVARGAATLLDNVFSVLKRLNVIDQALDWAFPGADEVAQDGLKRVLDQQVEQLNRIAGSAETLAGIWAEVTPGSGPAREAHHLLPDGASSETYRLQQADLAFLQLEVRRLRWSARLGMGPSTDDADGFELELFEVENRHLQQVVPEGRRVAALGARYADLARNSIAQASQWE
jgi:hypothetical protein